MSNYGYSLIFEQPYDYATNDDQIEKLGSLCYRNTILCFAGVLGYSENIDVLACTYCLDVKKITEVDRPTLRGAAWWYYRVGESIGFAPNSIIEENYGDTYDPNDMFRLSWNIDGSNGAYRLGNIIWPKSEYSKYVFAKYGDLGN